MNWMPAENRWIEFQREARLRIRRINGELPMRMMLDRHGGFSQLRLRDELGFFQAEQQFDGIVHSVIFPGDDLSEGMRSRVCSLFSHIRRWEDDGGAGRGAGVQRGSSTSLQLHPPQQREFDHA